MRMCPEMPICILKYEGVGDVQLWKGSSSPLNIEVMLPASAYCLDDCGIS